MRARPNPAAGGASGALALATVLLAAAAVPPAAADVELGLQLGKTFTVGSHALRWEGNRAGSPLIYETDPPDGGVALAAAVLWPWEDRFRFGVSVHAVDAGAWVFDEDDWRAVRDVPGDAAFGAVEMGQIDAFGAAWRVDALGPGVGRFGRTFASATYGYYRWKVDRPRGAATFPAAATDSLAWEVTDQGTPGAQQSAVGASLALGIERAFGPRHTVGISFSGTGLSSDFTRRYLGAHVEWRWRL